MTENQRRAVRAVVVLLVTSIAVSVAFSLLTLFFRHAVLDYQQARDPTADRAGLERTLWTRPIPVLVVAVLYAGVVRGLLAGSARSLRRVRVVSALGVVAIGWLILSGAYPPWLRAVQAGQLVVLVALAVAANRPVVRSAFPPPPSDLRPRNRRAALLLMVLAPLVAEVSLGTVPLRQAWVYLVLAPIYSASALLVREVVRRSGGGVLSLLLMGVAYGLIEEGLVLQSLTSPHLYGAAGWAPRLFGLNTAYAELNLVYHAVFSITIPILLTELAFARHGHAPYLRRGGVVASGVVALLGGVLLRVAVPPTEDPGYTIPLVAALVIVACVALLVMLALRISPGSARRSAASLGTPDAGARSAASGGVAAPPGAPVVAVVAAIAAFAFLACVWPFGGARQPLFTHGSWALLPMAVAAAIAAIALLTVRRWSASPAWSPRHLLAVLLGAVAGHTLFGLAVRAETPADRIFLTAVVIVTVTVGVWWPRHLAASTPTAPANPAEAEA